MKKIIIMMLTMSAVTVSAQSFLGTLAFIESANNPHAVGDNGKAVGIYQIHKTYVDDVNRIAGTSYTYDDRWDPDKSQAMVRIYLKHYGKRYTRLTGKKATHEVLARIHNGGPNGWRKSSTIPYLKRFRAARKKGL